MFSTGVSVSNRPPFESLLFIFVTVIIGFVVVGPLIGFAIANAVYEGDLFADMQTLVGPGLLTAILILQACSTLIGLILFPVIYITGVEKKNLSPLFPTQINLGIMLVMVAAIGLLYPIAMSPLTEWNTDMSFPDFMKGFEEWARGKEDELEKLVRIMTDIDTVGDLLIGILVIALLPAIGEELVFRGMIQQELQRGTKNIHLAIWMSAAIFSAIHLQFFGFIPRLLLGALFGYLYYWSGNLLIPIVSHFFNNAFAVVMLYLYKNEFVSIDVEGNEPVPLGYVMPAAIVTIVLLYYTRKHYLESGSRDQNGTTGHTYRETLD